MSLIRRLIEKWFHLEPETCSNCETLRLILESERIERNNLVQALIETTKPVKEETATVTRDLEPIRTSNYVPWRVRRQTLEAEDRKKAELLKKHSETVEELEQKIGINGTESEQGQS